MAGIPVATSDESGERLALDGPYGAIEAMCDLLVAVTFHLGHREGLQFRIVQLLQAPVALLGQPSRQPGSMTRVTCS